MAKFDSAHPRFEENEVQVVAFWEESVALMAGGSPISALEGAVDVVATARLSNSNPPPPPCENLMVSNYSPLTPNRWMYANGSSQVPIPGHGLGVRRGFPQ